MKNLESLLKRIQASLGRDTIARETILESIKEAAGFELGKDDISMKGDTLSIHTTPAKKSEIRLKEKKILEAINTRTGLVLKKIFYI